jgi:hypothetical protein
MPNGDAAANLCAPMLPQNLKTMRAIASEEEAMPFQESPCWK